MIECDCWYDTDNGDDDGICDVDYRWVIECDCWFDTDAGDESYDGRSDDDSVHQAWSDLAALYVVYRMD